LYDHDPLKCFFELSQELADINSAAAAILPVPYDKTATWKKGAARAPEAILEASHHIEFYDVVTDVEPGNWGIATLDPVEFDGPPEGRSLLAGITRSRSAQSGLPRASFRALPSSNSTPTPTLAKSAGDQPTTTRAP
jgi:arginase family enzyme